MLDTFFHISINSNFNLITLHLVVNGALGAKLTMHEEQNEPVQLSFAQQSKNRVLYIGNSVPGKPASRIYNSKHISIFSSVDSTTTGDRRTFPLMPFNPLSPAFFLHNQLTSDPPITFRHLTTMNLPLA